MSVMIDTVNGPIFAEDLEQGCQLKVKHCIEVRGGHGNVVLYRIADYVRYGTYTGFGLTGICPQQNDVRLFENGLWMWDGERWFNIDDCQIAVVPPVFFDEDIPNSEIPFCDFSEILDEEMEAGGCL